MNENILSLYLDIRRARQQGLAAIAQRQRKRLAELVAFARANSPYYRELYKGLPDRIEDPRLLPVTDKRKLMALFDDWGTDREVTLEKVRAFVDNPDLVGERFLGKYLVAATSGTTGTRGIFLMDDRAMAVNNALDIRLYADALGTGELIRLLAGGGRMAMVIATGGHFVGAAHVSGVIKSGLPLARGMRIFPVHTPLPELVAQLNHFRPAILIGYASTVALLADEQEAGCLHIHPVLVQLGAEGLAEDDYHRIAGAFDAKLSNKYAAIECPFVSYSCEHGWLHVNSDWVVLEPVDADYRPTPPGEQSHTVLLSNLANRAQPILRYDLGDSILQRPDPCPCGNPLPAIRVQGHAADVFTFPTGRGERITISPLAFSTLVERTPGVELFQIVQTAPASLRVRLRPANSADPDRTWQAVHTEITRLLASHNLDHVTVERAGEPPEQAPGGKYREIIPLR